MAYYQQAKALPKTDIQLSDRARLGHIDFPRQEPFCTPHEAAGSVDNEMFTKTLKSKLWALVQEFEAFGETERLCRIRVEVPPPKTVYRDRVLEHSRESQ